MTQIHFFSSFREFSISRFSFNSELRGLFIYFDLVHCFPAGEDEALTEACDGYYGLQQAFASQEPTAGRLMQSCSRGPRA